MHQLRRLGEQRPEGTHSWPLPHGHEPALCPDWQGGLQDHGIDIYNDTNASQTDINAAVDALRTAIRAAVSLYECDVPATYGIYNQGFENLSAQHDTESNNAQPAPFGWIVKKNGTTVSPASAGWYWAAINADGGSNMQGGHVWGVWNGSNYGNIELSQTLTEMPNGRWRLTALMMVSGNERNNQARLFLNNSSMLAGTAADFSSLPQGEECTFSGEWNDADNDMHQRFCVEADVNDGTLQFGVRSNGFFKVDDFQLTMLTPLPDDIEKPTADPSFRRGEQGAVYDLQGRRIPTPLLKEGQVENFPPGIYIVNGQKALVK